MANETKLPHCCHDPGRIGLIIDPRESALYRQVSPAALTAVLQGKGGSVGNALLEIYRLQ